MEHSVNINLETDVVTGEAVAHFVTSILEFLLYQRNQIPFVCKTFKLLVDKWNKTSEEDEAPRNFQLERQKTLAKQTMDSIKEMTKVIANAFEHSNVSCVRFLFGSTAITPKEVYTINVPSISRRHSYEHHKLQAPLLNQALIGLLTNDCLYETFSTNLCPTNVFLELEMPDTDAQDWEQLFSTDECELPPSCKQVVFNLVHTLPVDYEDKKCCREVKVFQDISSLSIGCDDERVEDLPTESSKQIGWWEASAIVRGFKQKSIKGSILWQ